MSKFKLPAEPGTTPKNIRFPNDMIGEIEKTICGTKISFSAFIIEAARAALESLKEEGEVGNNK